jgi:transcriptional regulator with XRE-family HTH domain
VLVTGNQLKAARALAGVDQQEVADSAGVNVNTIRNMEARGAEPITSSAVTVHRVQLALELSFSIMLSRAYGSESVSDIGAEVRRLTVQGNSLRSMDPG